MKTRGFTLIELLSVVTIIALISLISIPNIVKNVKGKKTEINDANMKLLSVAADAYIQNNPGKYNYNYEANGSTYCIPVQSLIDNGVLETPFKDVNGQEIDYSNVVKAIYQAAYNGFSYELVENGNCTETIQYVSRPQLSNNMIAVVYDEDLNKWVKADTTSHWYNYSEKKWANAVLVNEFKSNEANSKSRYEYKESPSGTPILESDVLAYFTWIPRFRYQLFSSTSPETINIVFESVSLTKSRGTAIGQWLTHPAFTYNNQELSGIWVGKYEASNSDNNIVIKSGLAPWTNIGYNDSFNLSNSMVNQNNIYGLSNVNTHLIQNNEWAAVAYLSNSIYGKNEKIELSNESTTGNNTGIYNMVGNKELVILKDEDENSLGYSLSETKSWYNETNIFTTSENIYLTRGYTSIFNYLNSSVIDQYTTFRITLINNNI